VMLAEWGVSFFHPALAAILVYLHCGCLGGLLISGFWSLINERFDPRTAKLRLGPISAWGTLGGAACGAVAAQVGTSLPATSMLPILSLLHFVSAVSVARLGSSTEGFSRPAVSRGDLEKSMRPGFLALSRSGYLRGLVGLVVLVTVCEGLIDLAFKGRVSLAMAQPGELLRFFAIFYAGTSLVTLLIQMLVNRLLMEKLGPARTAAILPAGVTVASAGALVAPGLATGLVARAVESVLSNSVFRGGYEQLFTPVSAREKRAVKPLADVGAARAGDLIAAGLAQGVLAIAAYRTPYFLTALALVFAIAAAWVAVRMNQGYVRSLERGLRSRAVELDLSEVRDGMTRSIMMKTLGPLEISRIMPGAGGSGPLSLAAFPSPEEGRLADIRSRDASRVRRALRQGKVTMELVPDTISLLSQDEVARDVIQALREAGPGVIEPLIVGLLDPAEEFAVRRRVPLVLATYVTPRSVEGLSHGLADRRFEVRYRCGRGLSHLTDVEPTLSVPRTLVYGAVLREVEVGVGVWEGRAILDRLDDEGWSPVVDEAIRERANRSLEHVFTLLALAHPREPLKIAFRGLMVSDPFLRGTALEYLESLLPPEIRKPLWPYLEDQRPRRAPTAKPTEEALAKLLRSNESIAIHLDELRKKGS